MKAVATLAASALLLVGAAPVADRGVRPLAGAQTRALGSAVPVYMLSPQFVRSGSGPIGAFAYVATPYSITGSPGDGGQRLPQRLVEGRQPRDRPRVAAARADPCPTLRPRHPCRGRSRLPGRARAMMAV